jgi:hypothetical protein
MMFQPSRDEVRRFFCDTWAKHRRSEALTGQERIAVACMLEHAEYHDLLDRPEAAIAGEFPVEAGRENPFLHLSLHLAIEEQLSIDQPRGLVQRVLSLTNKLDSRHDALHEVMECLAALLWNLQRGNTDMATLNHDYLECLDRRIGR